MIVDNYTAIARRAKDIACRVSRYPSNAELLPQIAASKELGHVNPELADMLTRIIDGWLQRPYFTEHSTFLDGSIHAETFSHLCEPRFTTKQGWRLPVALMFDQTKSQNPFAFYATVIQAVAFRAISKRTTCLDALM